MKPYRDVKERLYGDVVKTDSGQEAIVIHTEITKDTFPELDYTTPGNVIIYIPETNSHKQENVEKLRFLFRKDSLTRTAK